MFEDSFPLSRYMYKKMERLTSETKLVVKLVLSVNTGNVPYEHIFHEIYIPEDVRANFQLCGIDGFLSEPPYAPIGTDIEILYKGLVHMCSHQELYLQGRIYQPASYRKAVSMLAMLIYQCQKYPKARLEAHYLPKEVEVVSEQ